MTIHTFKAKTFWSAIFGLYINKMMMHDPLKCVMEKMSYQIPACEDIVNARGRVQLQVWFSSVRVASVRHGIIKLTE